MNGPAQPAYAWVVGHGGSGTKRVCHLLDLSPTTHCRYLNQWSVDSPQSRLPDAVIAGEGHDTLMAALWDPVVEWAKESWSESDRLPPQRKDHIRGPHRRALWSLVARPRARRMLARVDQRWLEPEHTMRPFLAELPRFSRAFLVMKTNQVPAWAAWVLRCRPEALVVHVVRHPGGVIRAWRARYAGAQPSPSLVSESRSRLRRVFQADPRWVSRIGDPQRMDPVEAEVWFWRYGTQLIHEAGLRSRSYLLVKDEDVWSEPSAVAGQIYARCGLETGAALEAWLAGMAESWRAHTAPWRSGLAATDIRSVERVLDDDLFAGWWTPGQKVSDSSYRAY